MPSAFSRNLGAWRFRVSSVTLVNGRALASGLAVIALAAIVGCGGAGSATADGAETSGGEAANYEGPIASTDVERGAERFETFCGGCHPGGQEDVGPSLIADQIGRAHV